ncbi:MAG TPA: phosphoribosylglycinamide synthetase C domain-containing protein, partial [Ensifer sp.]|nr:phosphoribosylglycinamide synthetase C domain-containing protein [Ensifer sp.]
VPILDQAMFDRAMREIVTPTVKALKDEGTPFKGVLYAGLMIGKNGPRLVEYNCRFGDPECQVLMMRLKSDLLELLLATAEGRLDQVTAEWRDETALTIVMASKGYPGSFEKNTPIAPLPAPTETQRIFHAGTALKDGQLVATGGRVLNVTAFGSSVTEAQSRAYSMADQVNWPNGFMRRDIGWRAVAREN